MSLISDCVPPFPKAAKYDTKQTESDRAAVDDTTVMGKLGIQSTFCYHRTN